MHSDDDSAEASVTEIDGVAVATLAQEALHVDIGELRRLLDEHRAATVIGVVPPGMSSVARYDACARAVEQFADSDIDAACAVVAVTDAIKRVRNGLVVETVARDALVWARPPVFVKRSDIEHALIQAVDGTTTRSLLPDPPATLRALAPSDLN